MRCLGPHAPEFFAGGPKSGPTKAGPARPRASPMREAMAESEFSDFKSFVIMNKLLQLLVTTLILICLLL